MYSYTGYLLIESSVVGIQTWALVVITGDHHAIFQSNDADGLFEDPWSEDEWISMMSVAEYSFDDCQALGTASIDDLINGTELNFRLISPLYHWCNQTRT